MEMDNQVLLISSIFPPQVGGPAIFTSRFSEWLIKNEVKVKILSYTNTNTVGNNKLHYKDLKADKTKNDFVSTVSDMLNKQIPFEFNPPNIE